jgi:hypothetical protein
MDNSDRQHWELKTQDEDKQRKKQNKKKSKKKQKTNKH